MLLNTLLVSDGALQNVLFCKRVENERLIITQVKRERTCVDSESFIKKAE